ncbi:glycerol-3-phosphate acyltransferase [Caldisericum exile]|uniref:Glycerol-3-phosphate acyltransferase n=1 Tax=Caldisericum exile (strain DSM 21853 / NBRC 104410 / AZM16c01) TaxID=511051 RepID=A0A7U6GFP9_CALEA|nr:glycerol-3-phosphate acyltransferase [Caldisericum exile]BAL81555.1 hypothetical membrane protein [Caldisericum exile AZM16c01]
MEQIRLFALYFLIEFLAGSIMFSYLIGLILHKDIRRYGDGNPGGFNLWHAAGRVAGIIGSLLDFAKGALPLYFIAKNNIFGSVPLSILAIAPLLGHMFSPLLKGRGGKGVATTFGIWVALTNFQIAILFAIALILYPLVFHKGYEESPEYNALRVVGSFLFIGVFVYILYREFLLAWFLNALLLIYSHRRELSDIPIRLKERFLG